MAQTHPAQTDEAAVPGAVRQFMKKRLFEAAGVAVLAVVATLVLALASWSAGDPSLNNAVARQPENLLGRGGAIVADELMQFLGLGVIMMIAVPVAWALLLFSYRTPDRPLRQLVYWLVACVAFAAFLSVFPQPASWLAGSGLGGTIGDMLSGGLDRVLATGLKPSVALFATGLVFCGVTVHGVFGALNTRMDDVLAFSGVFGSTIQQGLARLAGNVSHMRLFLGSRLRRMSNRAAGLYSSRKAARREAPRAPWRTGSEPPAAEQNRVEVIMPHGPVGPDERIEPVLMAGTREAAPVEDYIPGDVVAMAGGPDLAPAPSKNIPVKAKAGPLKKGKRLKKDGQPGFSFSTSSEYQLPPLTLLSEPAQPEIPADLSTDALEQNAHMLEGVLEDFGIRGEIVQVRPGPVVTLYELQPAPGIKSSRVIGLADDIARSMSAISARVAVVPGRNAIGIELPNSKRETVFLREMLASKAFEKSKNHLNIALGKDIGGEPVFADLARMPHLLIAGTTGSGKSVGINTMILSLLYRLPPDQCKLIMIDPKMLELSIYEGIPHLLAPVVTDPKKAVVALKWAVREMEERYRNMAKVGVRNIDGFNAKMKEAAARNEPFTRIVQTGFDPENGEPVFEQEQMDLKPLPFIVIIIDEMADLMMVAGKEIEGAVQRLAQMARAAGLHVIMATQRPSVDVITGTIKANFPTRISFQVTSKIDSRTILGEMGAEQLLGRGDMLYMAGGGKTSRLHGPFVEDDEVEQIVSFLKAQGAPDYLDAVTEEPEGEPYEIPGVESSAPQTGNELYDKAVAVVLRDKKVSTSYIQRRLQIGYNKAASLIEEMESQGLISAANHAGKREILVDNGNDEYDEMP